MTVIEAIIYGIVQGVAEFLPISSSGHLALVQNFFGTEGTEEFFTFNILLHFGTLIAVFIMYAKDVWSLIKGFLSLVARPFNGRLREKLDEGERLFLMICAATVILVPAALLSDKVELLSGYSYVIGILLIINGVMLFVSDRLSRGDGTLADSKLRRGLFIGLFQLCGVLPGISRSGSTITGGLFCNLERSEALRFSFLMSIPAILGANVLELLSEGDRLFGDIGLGTCLAGMATAAVAGIFAIKLLRFFAAKKSFTPFAVYCLIAGTAAIIGDAII